MQDSVEPEVRPLGKGGFSALLDDEFIHSAILGLLREAEGWKLTYRDLRTMLRFGRGFSGFILTLIAREMVRVSGLVGSNGDQFVDTTVIELISEEVKASTEKTAAALQERLYGSVLERVIHTLRNTEEKRLKYGPLHKRFHERADFPKILTDMQERGMVQIMNLVAGKFDNERTTIMVRENTTSR